MPHGSTAHHRRSKVRASTKAVLKLAQAKRWDEVLPCLHPEVVDTKVQVRARTVLLVQAVIAKQADVVRAALASGADPNLLIHESGVEYSKSGCHHQCYSSVQHSLMHSAYSGNSILHMLLVAGGGVDFNMIGTGMLSRDPARVRLLMIYLADFEYDQLSVSVRQRSYGRGTCDDERTDLWWLGSFTNSVYRWLYAQDCIAILDKEVRMCARKCACFADLGKKC